FELGWRPVVPKQGSFNWTDPDRFIGAMAARHIRPLPFVWGSPGWVATNPASPPIDTAAHEQAWTNFLKAAVHRYGPGGSYWGAPYHERYGPRAVPLPIKSWQ